MLFYHGTSEKYLNNILENGLTIDKKYENQVYKKHDNTDYDQHSIQSMHGIYLTIDREVAKGYAENSSEQTGTDELILKIDIPVDGLVIDEDAINFESDIKDFLRSSYMSTDNDGFFQLKNMILDIDTSELLEKELQNWYSTGYSLKSTAIERDDIIRLTTAYINRMASHCYGWELALQFLTEEARQDIQDIFQEGYLKNKIINKYEDAFMKEYDKFILKYSEAILSKKYNNKNFRSLTDIAPECISICQENNLKM